MGCLHPVKPEFPAGIPLARPSHDLGALLHLVEGDLELLRDMVRLYLDLEPEALRDLGGALRDRNGEAVARQAHALKSALSTLHASAGVRAVVELEKHVRSGRIDYAEQTWKRLVRELSGLRQELEPLIRTQA